MHNHKSPPVDAGSMADIAFLLLIFFLMTTVIPDDQGISQKLPQNCANSDCTIVQLKRNVLKVFINDDGQLMVNESLVAIHNLKKLTMDFIDNNGIDPKLSESPKKAVISLKSNRGTPYSTYINVQNELLAAYASIRNDLAKTTYKKEYVQLNSSELKEIKALIPQIISEAETN